MQLYTLALLMSTSFRQMVVLFDYQGPLADVSRFFEDLNSEIEDVRIVIALRFRNVQSAET